jgi:hypothetical protein
MVCDSLSARSRCPVGLNRRSPSSFTRDQASPPCHTGPWFPMGRLPGSCKKNRRAFQLMPFGVDLFKITAQSLKSLGLAQGCEKILGGGRAGEHGPEAPSPLPHPPSFANQRRAWRPSGEGTPGAPVGKMGRAAPLLLLPAPGADPSPGSPWTRSYGHGSDP